MSRETSALLERLASEDQSPVVRHLRALLNAPETRVLPFVDHPALVSVLEPIWRVRQQHALSQSRRFVGLSSLLANLQKSSASRQIEIYSVVSDRESGTIFFDANTKEFVGTVIVVMSAHTRAYFRGELTGSPTGARLNETKRTKPVARSMKQKKVLA
jgi:hypothetical protein